MRTSLLSGQPGERTFAVVFEPDDDAIEHLPRFALEQRIGSAAVSGVGAFSRLTLGYVDRSRGSCTRIEIDEPVEVLAFMGCIGQVDGRPMLHAHVVVGKMDGTALGGHLLDASIWPTLELVVAESPGHLRPRFDEALGLALINVRRESPAHLPDRDAGEHRHRGSDVA